MKLIRGLQNLRSSQLGSVVTIGTYDGLHLGHLSLLRRLAEHGARMSRPTMMLTFEPMPREFFAPANPPPRLTSLRERCRLLQRMGLDSLCVLRFDERLRDMTGEAFAQLLARDMRAAVVVIGHDFKFGRGAEAAAAAMQAKREKARAFMRRTLLSCCLGRVGERQFEQTRRIAPEDRFFVVLRQVEVVDQLDGARLQ